MSASFFSIGLTGLSVAQQNLLTTEHNIVNANTPGFSRQRVLQAVGAGVMSGTGTIGQGVRSVTVERLYDQFITSRKNSDQAQASALESFYSQIRQIDGLLADSSAGLSPGIQNFFEGAQQVATNPSLLPARQSMVSSAETLVARFQSLDGRLKELQENSNDRIKSAVAAINGFAAQIGELNRGIMASEASYGQPANDLRDQRDQIIADLNKLVKVSAVPSSDGSVNLFIGAGQQLVVGATVVTMLAEPSNADPAKIGISMQYSSVTKLELPDSLVTGGELGGLLTFRNNALQQAANDIGRVAASLALTINAQHALGQDLGGRIAGETGFESDFFKIPTNLKIFENRSNTLPSVGVMTATFAAPDAPSGPTYEGNFKTQLNASDYEVEFNATGFTVTRLSDGHVFAPNATSFDGIALSVATPGSNGQRFLIQPYADVTRGISVNSSIAADPRLVAAAAPVRVSPALTNTGSMKLAQGVMGVGYTAPASASPVTLQVTAGGISVSPAGVKWRAVYANAQGRSGTGELDLIPTVGTGGAQLQAIEFNGMSFAVAGLANVGDSFVVARNASGVQDGRNALLFSKLQNQNTIADGSATYQSSYARLAADNGIKTREAKIQLDARNAILEQTTSTRDSLSAVNLDEEAANLLKFQQAYQASAKILDVGGKLFESILAIG